MSMPFTVLHINSVNFGSTGNIMLNIASKVKEKGNMSYVAYANSRTNRKKNIQNSILIGSIIERNIHIKLAYFTGLNGCFSKKGTKKFLEVIDNDIKPDIIHLHNLHNCYINLKLLFDYIKNKNLPVVWTLHDCWAFTGQCPHFTMAKCDKWKTICFDCPQYREYPSSRVDRTREMYIKKKKWFTGVNNLTIVTPSQWLANRVKESFLKQYPIKVINNGINLNIFKPTSSNFRIKYNLTNKILLLGVANSWSQRKGLNIFIDLSKRLENNYKIVLVGLTKEQIKRLPSNIIGIQRTESNKELAEIYTAADFFINPSLEETMGLVTLESLACGTPVIVSNSTAVPEVVTNECGIVVSNYNSESFFYEIINNKKEFKKEDCIKQAKNYDMNKKYEDYLNLYDSILIKN